VLRSAEAPQLSAAGYRRLTRIRRTFAPSPANRIAVARPIPLPAPVMKATLPASIGIALLLFDRNFEN
jgi:hypothetical protein